MCCYNGDSLVNGIASNVGFFYNSDDLGNIISKG
jgi:hypothetical protein